MSSHQSVLNRRGQVTIPVAIRERLGLRPGDRVAFDLAGDAVSMGLVRSNLSHGYGAVTPLRRPEDFGSIREAFEQGVADDVARFGS